MTQTMARCENRVNCDLALRNDLIEMTQDGRCPECGQPLHAIGSENNSATDDARRKRSRFLVVTGSALSLVTVGVLAWVLTGNDSQTPADTSLSSASIKSDYANNVAATPPIEIPVATPPIVDIPPVIAVEPEPPKPAVTTPTLDPLTAAPSLETQQHVKQGMMFVSLAKQSPATRSENIKNALAEFDAAVKREDAQGRCYANAYMNRGIAYWQDKKFNLAERDLIKASECGSNDPIIFYNLASYYSAMNKTDLALEPLDKALTLGFNDCDILRKDTDLNNLRKMSDFRRILESHQLFCLK